MTEGRVPLRKCESHARTRFKTTPVQGSVSWTRLGSAAPAANVPGPPIASARVCGVFLRFCVFDFDLIF